MNAIRRTKELNDRELENCTPPSASWHRDYADTAFIYIGGLDLRLSEGDVITIFSQYGEPDFINLVRDRETGKSKGFAFLRYRDQRSTDLAVDNLGGASVMGRLLNVEHTRYKKRDDEELADNTRGFLPGDQDEGESEDSEPERPLLEEEKQLAKLLRDVDDEDPMKGELVRAKKDEVERALRRRAKEERRRERGHHRHGESRSHRKSKHDGDDDRREKKRRRSRSREGRD
jgi:RNA-binding motif X-linked protein 2